MLPMSRTANASEIPVIDLEGRRFSSADVERCVTRAIAEASSGAGFFYITNHGVDATLVEDMFEAAREFFSLPIPAKEEVSLKRSGYGFRGYLPSFHKGDDPNLKENLQEAFQIHAELSDQDPDVLAGLPMHGPNVYPTAMPTLKARMLQYEHQLRELGNFLLMAMAVGLRLPRDHFDSFFRKPMPMLRLLHYPPQSPTESGDHIGTRGHTDTGVITILAQDDVGGLEILLKNGEWVLAPPIEGTFIVNLGEVMKAWSDGIYSATPHRVINRYGLERFSVPYFVNPDYRSSFAPHVVNSDPKDPRFLALIPNEKNLSYGDWVVEVFSRIYHRPETTP
jgi:isopenicillin N synthase-like dioxygenase